MVNELDDLMQSRASYLNHKLLTNPCPCVKKTTANKLQPLTREHAQFPASSNERGTAERQGNELRPITLSSTSPRALVVWERDNPACLHSGPSESSAEPSLSRRTAVLVTNFCIFTVQQWCKHLSCLLFTCAYQLSLLYTYTSLLYTCSTVNVIALNTVPPGTGE